MFSTRLEDDKKLNDARKLRERMVMEIHRLLMKGKSEDEIHVIMNEMMSDGDLEKLKLVRDKEYGKRSAK